MTDWLLSDEARDAGRDVPDLDEKALVISGYANEDGTGRGNWAEPEAEFCPDCHFAWWVHDSRKVAPFGWKGPFGCPPNEKAAREAPRR